MLGGICLDDSIFLLFIPFSTLTGVVKHLYRYKDKNVEYASVQRITLLTNYVYRSLYMTVLVLCLNRKVQYCFRIFGENICRTTPPMPLLLSAQCTCIIPRRIRVSSYIDNREQRLIANTWFPNLR